MKCGSSKCNEEATHRVFWPGREPVPMCDTCSQRAWTVGNSMGCPIHTETIPVAETPPPRSVRDGMGDVAGLPDHQGATR